MRQAGSRRRGRTPNRVRAAAARARRGHEGTSCRWWRPRNGWARRSPSRRGGGSVHDDLVETADAFLALDDDDVVWNEGDDEEDDDDASSATRSRRRRRSWVPAQLSISGRLLARRRRCRPLPTTSCRARSPSRRCWRSSTRRRRTTVETAILRGPSRSRPAVRARARGTPNSMT